MTSRIAQRSAAARPSVVRTIAAEVTRTVVDWTPAAALEKPAAFGKAVLASLIARRDSRMLPMQATRDAIKAGGIMARTPNPATRAAATAARAKRDESQAWHDGVLDILGSIPNPAGVTIGRIDGCAADRALTLRDLIDGLALPPSQSEVAAWLAAAE